MPYTMIIPAAMGFLFLDLGTEERVRSSHVKRAISVPATEGLPIKL